MLTAAGAAVGLGNIWGFTFVAGKNGGGGFLLAYLAALMLVAAPIFMAELALGRLGKRSGWSSPPGVLRALQASRVQKGARGKPAWGLLGLAGVAASILILSFYTVIAGEVLHFLVVSAAGVFGAAEAGSLFTLDKAHHGAPVASFLWGAVFCVFTVFIVARDINSGLERMSSRMMPALFLMLVAMVAYSAVVGDMAAAADFLLGFNEGFGPQTLLEAAGQAFFSVSVGVGGILLLGAYTHDETNLSKSAFWIIMMDLVAALLAGFAIFPIVFSKGLEPNAGPGLVFQTVPHLFSDLPGGQVAVFVFFLLVSFAAITSSIALMAPGVAWLTERGLTRAKAALILGAVTLVLSVLTVLSLSVWSGVHPLAAIGFEGDTAFDLIREGVNNIYLPLGGLLFALIAGWGLGRAELQAALGFSNDRLFGVWYSVLRYFVPLAVLALFFFGIW